MQLQEKNAMVFLCIMNCTVGTVVVTWVVDVNVVQTIAKFGKTPMLPDARPVLVLTRTLKVIKLLSPRL